MLLGCGRHQVRIFRERPKPGGVGAGLAGLCKVGNLELQQMVLDRLRIFLGGLRGRLCLGRLAGGSNGAVSHVGVVRCEVARRVG